MTEAQIRSVAIFFYYSLPGELYAMEATERALQKIEKKWKPELASFEHIAVSVCNEIAEESLRKFEREKEKLDSRVFPSKYINVRVAMIKISHLSLGPWKQFVKEVNPKDLFLLIWVHLLDFDRNTVAVASGITTGTLQYRVSALLRTMSLCLTPGSREHSERGNANA